MTRATLLRLLAHPTALNGADVRALEELAEAFPYCQTAHLLLAKAAHDQDSMLAGQRLRRAATYAADRTLLRQLVEAAPVEELVEALPATAATEYTGYQGAAYATGEYPASEPAPSPLAEAVVPAPAALLLEDKPAQEVGPAPSPSTSQEVPLEAAVSAPPAQTALVVPAEAAPAAEPIKPRLGAPAAAFLPDEAANNLAANAEAAVPAPVATAAAPTEAELVNQVLAPDRPAAEGAAAALADSLATATAFHSENEESPSDPALPFATPTEPTLAGESASVATRADDLPALGEESPPQAPPIRPPAEAAAARQEFGLSPEEPTEITAYQLPELELAITIPLTPADATPRLPPFSGVSDVGYAPGEGSRFGYCLVPATPPAGAPGGSLVPGAALPPPGEFFMPDALLLAHVATQPAAATSSTTDLINSFLLRTPGNQRRRAQLPAKASEQADLSVRSTRAAPDLASESLARILTQQGKVEQAIAIYERLMVKNPEKMAYFVTKIDLLRP